MPGTMPGTGKILCRTFLFHRQHRQGHGRIRGRQCGGRLGPGYAGVPVDRRREACTEGYGRYHPRGRFRSVERTDGQLRQGRGKVWVCSPCFKKRKLDENNLIRGRDHRWRRETGGVPVRRDSVPVVSSTSSVPGPTPASTAGISIAATACCCSFAGTSIRSIAGSCWRSSRPTPRSSKTCPRGAA